MARIHLPRPGHSQQFRDQVLETYRKKGLAAACREHGVDKLTVYKYETTLVSVEKSLVFFSGGAATRRGREAVGFFPLSVKQKLLPATTRMDWVKPVQGFYQQLSASLIV